MALIFIPPFRNMGLRIMFTVNQNIFDRMNCPSVDLRIENMVLEASRTPAVDRGVLRRCSRSRLYLLLIRQLRQIMDLFKIFAEALLLFCGFSLLFKLYFTRDLSHSSASSLGSL